VVLQGTGSAEELLQVQLCSVCHHLFGRKFNPPCENIIKPFFTSVKNKLERFYHQAFSA